MLKLQLVLRLPYKLPYFIHSTYILLPHLPEHSYSIFKKILSLVKEINLNYSYEVLMYRNRSDVSQRVRIIGKLCIFCLPYTFIGNSPFPRISHLIFLYEAFWVVKNARYCILIVIDPYFMYVNRGNW